jgi:hypothetical protein
MRVARQPDEDFSVLRKILQLLRAQSQFLLVEKSGSNDPSRSIVEGREDRCRRGLAS